MSTIEVKTANGVREGTLAELRGWIADGIVDATSEIRHESLTDGKWRPLGQTTLVTLLGRAQPLESSSEPAVAALLRRRDQYRALITQKPFATFTLMALNALALLLVIGLCGELSPLTLFVFGSKANAMIRGGEWWRLFTAPFLHASLPHLALNLFALYVIGRLVEGAFGSLGLLVSYLGAAGAGTLASFFASPNQSVGASGAIFGLLGTALVFSLRSRRELPAASRLVLVGSLVFWLAFTLYIGFTQANVDNVAHLGGLAWGLLVPLALPSRLSDERKQRAGRLLTRAAAAVLIAATLVSFAGATRFVLRSGFVGEIEGVVIDHPRVSLRVPYGFRVEQRSARALTVVDWLGSFFQLELHIVPRTHRPALAELRRHIEVLVASKNKRVAAKILATRETTVAGHKATEATIRIESDGRLLLCDSLVIDLDRERLFLHLYRLDRVARHFDRATALVLRSLRIRPQPTVKR